MRPLGIPTVADRVAQMVAKQFLEPELEKHTSTRILMATGRANRHWMRWGWRGSAAGRSDWVLDLDIKGLFRQYRS